MKTIASRLREARKKAKLTQKDVAEKVGLSPQAISNFERGTNRVSNDILRKLCELYNISADTILYDSTVEDSSLVDLEFMRLLKALGYRIEGLNINQRLYIGDEDSRIFPITPDEYTQLRDSFISYIHVNTDLLINTARTRERNLNLTDMKMIPLSDENNIPVKNPCPRHAVTFGP